MNYDYKKMVHYLNEITSKYRSDVQPLIFDTSQNTTYLFTLRATSNKHILELKQIKALFLRFLQKSGFMYFSVCEVSNKGLFHYHIDILIPKSFRLKSLIDSYFANSMVKKYYSNIIYHLEKINYPEQNNYDYPIKMFNKQRAEPFQTSDFETEEFFKYMRRLNKDQINSSIYKIFDTNIFETVSYKEFQTLKYKVKQFKFSTSVSLVDKTKSLEEVFDVLGWSTVKTSK